MLRIRLELSTSCSQVQRSSGVYTACCDFRVNLYMPQNTSQVLNNEQFESIIGQKVTTVTLIKRIPENDVRVIAKQVHLPELLCLTSFSS